MENNVDLLHFLKMLQDNANNQETNQDAAQITPNEQQLKMLAELNKKELDRGNPNINFLLKLNKDFTRVF